MNQDRAFEILQSGENVFLTGSAGTGKSFLLNKFISYLKDKEINVGITASTGIASTHIMGTTIHSWSGIGISKDINDPYVKRFLNRRNSKKIKEIKNTKVLIIDEISMIDSKCLNLIDIILKLIKNPFSPFGGMQIVVCGDFFQLPPIDGSFAYNSPVWKDAKFKVCYLEKQYRQNDQDFIDILNNIRRNTIDENNFNKIKSRIGGDIKGFDKVTKLYTHNIDVDEINRIELSCIKEKEVEYHMSSSGNKKISETLKKHCLAPEVLKLKKGAIVMFLKNNFKEGYVNGTLGTVAGFDNNNFPIIELKNGSKIIARQEKWDIEVNGEVLASISQLPLRLAWAITIHKSQGMSLDVAEIDLSKSFNYGMGYVALSRVKRLDSIKLIGINQNALMVNKDVVEKDKEFINLSKENE